MGKTMKKVKYIVLAICAARMNGASAGQLPSQVRRRNVPVRDQNISCFTGHQVHPIWSFLLSSIGRVASTRIAANRAITPPSLFGTDRRIAYTHRKYHSGLIWAGVLRGLAGM